MTNRYATVTQFGEFTNTIRSTLDRDEGTFLEVLGVGDNSKSMFILKQKGAILSSLILFYGSSEQSALDDNQTLTLTTHYTVSDEGVVTLTSAGKTLLDTNNLYAEYYFFSEEYNNNMVQRVLDTGAALVDEYCNTTWQDTSIATPEYTQTLNKTYTGKGLNNRYYFLDSHPLPNVSTTLDGAVSQSDNTITVTSTTGFPSSGVLEVDGLKLEYTGKDSTTFTGVSGVSRDVDTGLTILPYCFEASNTPDGYEPVWTVLKQDSDYYFDKDNGRVYLSKTTPYTSGTLYFDLAPEKGVPMRFRGSFISGSGSIPEPITQATIMIAQRLLTSSTIASATMKGVDGFSPRANDVLNQDIKMLLKEYRLLQGYSTS